MLYDTNCLKNVEPSSAVSQIVNNHDRMKAAMTELFSTFERTDQLKSRKLRNNEFDIGQSVLVRNHRRTHKTQPLFIDNFVITEKLNEYTYFVKNLETDKISKYHVT